MKLVPGYDSATAQAVLGHHSNGGIRSSSSVTETPKATRRFITSNEKFEPMKRRFILYRRKRGGVFYVEDTDTRKQESPGTKNRALVTARACF